MVRDLLLQSANLKQRLADDPAFVAAIEQSAQLLLDVVRGGGTIYACGNGGSSCDAMHLVEELVARYKRERPGIRAHHLMDAATLTCWSNDYDFNGAFERQAKTFLTSKDVLVAISTSGNSENVLRAARAAKAQQARVIGLSGKTGGALAALCDAALIVPSDSTERIQEAHITIIHLWCELIERSLLNLP